VLRCFDQSDRHKPERSEDGNGIAMNRAGEAMQTVPAEARPPMEVRLEEREGEGAHDSDYDEASGEPERTEAGRRDDRPGLERAALADRQCRGSDDSHGGEEREP
jgi:hypothetical protein